MTADLDAIPVTFTVSNIRRLSAGRLLALATVTIDLGDVEIALHRIQVVRLATGRVQCRAPHYRDPTGAWKPATTLPPELEDAIGMEVLRVAGYVGETQ